MDKCTRGKKKKTSIISLRLTIIRIFPSTTNNFWIIHNLGLFIPLLTSCVLNISVPCPQTWVGSMLYSLVTQSAVPRISSTHATWELVRCAECRSQPDMFWSCILIRSWGHSYACKCLRCPALEGSAPATWSFLPRHGVRQSQVQVAGLPRACTPSPSKPHPGKPWPWNFLPK